MTTQTVTQPSPETTTEPTNAVEQRMLVSVSLRTYEAIRELIEEMPEGFPEITVDEAAERIIRKHIAMHRTIQMLRERAEREAHEPRRKGLFARLTGR